MIKQPLRNIVALTLLATLLAGCTTRRQVMPTGPIPIGKFVQAWQAPLDIGANNRVTNLYLTDSALYVYTSRNLVYCLSPSGGQVFWIQQVSHPGDQLSPPVQIKGATVIAVNSTIWVLGPEGKVSRKLNIGHSIRSPLAVIGDVAYCGVDYPNGGRLAKIDLTRPYNFTRWELLTGRGISATPAVYEESIYCGSENGNVYAVNEDRDPIWPLEGSLFQTDGPIVAGLRADNYGVYVASMDSKLYCLDRQTGKLKWQYYAGHPLDRSPDVTADSVYQPITGVGVAAIDKTAQGLVHAPRWLVRGAKQYLGEDSQFVYLRDGDNSVVGVDKQTGKQQLHSTRTDLRVFASNSKNSMVYAATADGLVLGMNAVTAPGAVGQLVQSSRGFQSVALAR